MESIMVLPDCINKNIERLGYCEVCNKNKAKYTCPKCEVKTCCLECVKIHKKELKCNGVRDRTKYIPLKEMKEKDFMSDYYFLEECTRFTKDIQNFRNKNRNNGKRHELSKIFYLKKIADERKTTLKILSSTFRKRNENTSHYNRKIGAIYWRIEWIFSNAQCLKLVDKFCSENETISNLLEKYLNPNNEKISSSVKKHLEYYQSKGLSNLKVLLKAEGIKSCKNRFYELNLRKTLKSNLVGKIIIEFPCIHVCYDVENLGYDIIDDSNTTEILKESKELFNEIRESLKEQKQWVEEQTKIDMKCKTDEEIAEELRKIEEERLIWEKYKSKKRGGCNYFFSNETDESESSDSDLEKNI